MIRLFALFALLSVSVAMPALAQRATLPVRMVELPNGNRRFTTTLVIDGKPVEVGIDTGSTGLRVLPRGLGVASLGKRGSRITYSYGAGTGFDGESIAVSVGAGVLTGPVKVMRITGVGCVSGHPDCPVAHLDLATYGIQGDGLPNQGFAAILGIRLKADPVTNPFEQLGVKRWIVELPRRPLAGGPGLCSIPTRRASQPMPGSTSMPTAPRPAASSGRRSCAGAPSSTAARRGCA